MLFPLHPAHYHAYTHTIDAFVLDAKIEHNLLPSDLDGLDTFTHTVPSSNIASWRVLRFFRRCYLNPQWHTQRHHNPNNSPCHCRSNCPEYTIAAFCLLPIVMLPFLAISYLLYIGVTRHTVFVWKEGNFFTRFYHAMGDSQDRWTKYCGFGFLLALNEAYTEAKENGEWRVRFCFYMHILCINIALNRHC